MFMQTTAYVFVAKDYVRALSLKEQIGGIMERWSHPTMGPVYEVRPLPPPAPPEIFEEDWPRN